MAPYIALFLKVAQNLLPVTSQITFQTSHKTAMKKDRQRQIVNTLLQHWKQGYAAETGINLQNKPAALFQLLVASLLFSARIDAAQATQAATALFKSRLTTPEKMYDAGWEARVEILNRNGYARYDESTSRMLGDTSDLLINEYAGDLRRLRERSRRCREEEIRLLQDFKGIGKAGAAIFVREVQSVWPEAFPFIDRHGQQGAEKLGLPKTASVLAELVDGPQQMAQLASCLVRVDLMSSGAGKSLLEKIRC